MIGKQIGGLQLAVVDAIAGNAVEVEIDVHAVLFAKVDGSVELSQRLVVDVSPVGGLAPDPIRERETGEVETHSCIMAKSDSWYAAWVVSPGSRSHWRLKPR